MSVFFEFPTTSHIFLGKKLFSNHTQNRNRNCNCVLKDMARNTLHFSRSM